MRKRRTVFTYFNHSNVLTAMADDTLYEPAGASVYLPAGNYVAHYKATFYAARSASNGSENRATMNLLKDGTLQLTFDYTRTTNSGTFGSFNASLSDMAEFYLSAQTRISLECKIYANGTVTNREVSGVRLFIEELL